MLELAPDVGGTSRGGTLKGLRHPWGAHYLPIPREDQRALATLLLELGVADGVESDGRLHVPMEYRVRAPAERVYALGYWEEGLWLQSGEAQQDRDQQELFEALLNELGRPADDGRPFELPVKRSSTAQRALDAQSGTEWADRHGLTGERMRWYLEYATRDDFGARLQDTSAWALLHYFNSRLSKTGAGAEYMTWPEGNAWLVARMREALDVPMHTSHLATRVRPAESQVEVDVFDVGEAKTTTWTAQHVVMALPQFVNTRLLEEDPAAEARRAFRYSPWVVANLHLSEAPLTRGYPQSWDNVLYHSDSLGYIDATHQIDRSERDALWTWYLPLTDPDERTARHMLMQRPWEDWRDIVLNDLAASHPGLLEVVTHIDVWRFGHAMVKPVPGFLWGQARKSAAEALGNVHFAHSDLSGMAIFEEANWQGVRAAEEVCRAMNVDTEALI